jgi:spore germination protein GerM
VRRFGDVGTVKDALKTLLLGPDFEQALQTVEQRFTDGLHLERLSAAQVSTCEVTGTPPPFPYVEMVAGVSTFREQDEDREPADHAITLVWWADADDEQAATKLVERYVLATRKMLIGELLAPLVPAFPVRVVKEELSPLTFRKETTSRVWVKSKLLEIVVPTHDTEG